VKIHKILFFFGVFGVLVFSGFFTHTHIQSTHTHTPHQPTHTRREARPPPSGNRTSHPLHMCCVTSERTNTMRRRCCYVSNPHPNLQPLRLRCAHIRKPSTQPPNPTLTPTLTLSLTFSPNSGRSTFNHFQK